MSESTAQVLSRMTIGCERNSVDYREWLPPRDLHASILCLWSLESSAGSRPHHQPVLPDGCVDLVWFGDEAPRIAGPGTRPLRVAVAPGTRVFGIRIRPGWADQCLGLPAEELLDQTVPVAEIDRVANLASFERPDSSFEHHVRFAATVRDAFGFAPSSVRRTGIVEATIRLLSLHPHASVARVAAGLGLSSRQLQRHFVAAVGYGPKMFHRIVRLQKTLALGTAYRCARGDLAHLAFQAGYSDQAHMTRDFRELVDATPREIVGHLDSTLHLSDFFKIALPTSR